MNFKTVLITLMAITSLIMVTAVVATESADAVQSTAFYEIRDVKDVSTSDSLTMTLYFEEGTNYSSMTTRFTASLYKDGKAVTGALSPSTGLIEDGGTYTVTMSKREDPGLYTIKVTFNEKLTFPREEGETKSKTIDYKHEISQSFNVVVPIKFNVTLKNDAKAALQNESLVFYLDGKELTESKKEVSVEIGKTQDVSYTYTPIGLSPGKHTYYLMSETGFDIQGIGENYQITFYYKQPNYDYLNYVSAGAVIILLVALAWVYSKPVKNRGKPKSRR